MLSFVMAVALLGSPVKVEYSTKPVEIVKIERHRIRGSYSVLVGTAPGTQDKGVVVRYFKSRRALWFGTYTK